MKRLERLSQLYKAFDRVIASDAPVTLESQVATQADGARRLECAEVSCSFSRCVGPLHPEALGRRRDGASAAESRMASVAAREVSMLVWPHASGDTPTPANESACEIEDAGGAEAAGGACGGGAATSCGTAARCSQVSVLT